MRHPRFLFLLVPLLLATISSRAQKRADSDHSASSAPWNLTIYNQDFAVARTAIPLDLKAGANEVTTTQVTSQLEPDSVVLRDSSSATPAFRILEQNYDAAIVTQDWLLQHYEGKTIHFQLPATTASPGPVIEGKIIRAPIDGAQPLVEINSQLQFQLPGTPLFPTGSDPLLLKPTLRWQILANKPLHSNAELAYITGGLTWEANYNIVAPGSSDSVDSAKDDLADLIGWITIHNSSGTDFPEASIKLMAGDVAKIQPQPQFKNRALAMSSTAVMVQDGPPQVTQKSFDDFHLYDLNRSTTLTNGETKQVQFVEAAAVPLHRTYIYDGGQGFSQPWQPQPGNEINRDQNFGVYGPSTKVQIGIEFKNSTQSHLGMPLPAGRIRLYRRDGIGANAQIEFTGEATIPHTPTEDTVKISTGSAFDLKGTRRQTSFHIDDRAHTLDETFEIKLTNQKSSPVTINVQEHLNRGQNWTLETSNAAPPTPGASARTGVYEKIDSHTIQFPTPVPAKGEATVSYTVHYTW